MRNRLFAIAGWGIVAIIIIATLVPLGMRPHMSDNANLERFAAFGTAGLLLGLAYPRRFLLVVIFTIALACGLEALQQFAVDRHGRLGDMSVKVAGSLAGLFVAGLILRLQPSR